MKRVCRLLVVMVLVGALSALSAAPALAAQRTATFQVNLTVPVIGATALGTLTVTYDDVTGQGSWQFQGTINGVLAQASGTGTYVITSASGIRGLASAAQTGLTLGIDSIDTWNMPGIARVEGRSASLTVAGNLAYVTYHGPSYTVTGVPIAVSPAISFPLEGSYTLMNPATGEQPVTTLPNTGVAPDGVSLDSSPFASIVILMAALIIAFGVMSLAGRRLLASTTA